MDYILKIERAKTMKQFPVSIDWPNGEGFTPCTIEARNVQDEIDNLSDFGATSMDDMTPVNYQRFNELLNKQGELQNSGHYGKSVRY